MSDDERSLIPPLNRYLVMRYAPRTSQPASAPKIVSVARIRRSLLEAFISARHLRASGTRLVWIAHARQPAHRIRPITPPTLYILDAAGEPIRCEDSVTWGAWFDRADRCVAEDWIGSVRISTVFLGIDQGGGPPLLWETMIYGETHYLYRRRYATRAEAEAGHAAAVAMVEGT
jgi:hypothetical protein